MPAGDDLPDELNLAWSDPDLERAVRALVRGDAQTALDLLSLTVGDADRRELYADVLGGAGQYHLPLLRGLAERDQGDTGRWLLLGSALAAAAWTARGAAVAEQTTPEQFEGLVTLTGQAREALHRAAALAPSDAVPWSQLMGCALGAPDHDGESDEVFAEVTRLAPDLFGANELRLTTLTRKWYGSQDRVLAFARARTEGLPAGHPLLALIAYAHIEGHVDGMMGGNVVGRLWRALRYLNDKKVRGEVDGASERLLQGADDFVHHPWSMAAHQAFAALYHQTMDAQRALPHLERGGRRPMPWPWGYFGDHKVEFADARKAAGILDE